MTEDLHVSDDSLTFMHAAPAFENTPCIDPAAPANAEADANNQ